MCAVSNVGDDYSKRTAWPTWPNQVPFPVGSPQTDLRVALLETGVHLLKQQVEKMHEELRAAKAKDVAEGNPDCEMEDKVAILKQIAKLVGVDLGDVFPNDKS